MLYRKLTKQGPPVSLLGYGCMRFKSKGSAIDKELAFSQMKLAFDGGVNYFDTAYLYHGGKSEGLLGEFIKRYDLRDKIYIADKLPIFLVSKSSQIEKYFETQLKRLDTDYIDYYLMHMLVSFSDWEKLKTLGIIDFIEQKKKSGQIKHIGFSFHGDGDEFLKIIEDYDWDFCQIQYNYLDEYNQAGLRGLEKAKQLGIGVVVMEPLRGGDLAANAPDKVQDIFASYSEKKSPAYWGLRFAMNHDGVATVLSGMNESNHILENIDVASTTTENSMSLQELEIIENVKKTFFELNKVGCTGCGYCKPCPFGVDISNIFNDYNGIHYFPNKKRFIKTQYIGKTTGFLGDKCGANLCTNCKKCVKHCPQNIDIPSKLKEAHKQLDMPFIRTVAGIVAKIMGKGKK